MSIAETAVREAVASVVREMQLCITALEKVANDPEDPTARFAQIQMGSRQRDLAIVRRELAEWLPCACGKPSIGPDITGAQMCSRCADQAAHAIEEVGLSTAGMIPTQPTRDER